MVLVYGIKFMWLLLLLGRSQRNGDWGGDRTPNRADGVGVVDAAQAWWGRRGVQATRQSGKCGRERCFAFVQGVPPATSLRSLMDLSIFCEIQGFIHKFQVDRKDLLSFAINLEQRTRNTRSGYCVINLYFSISTRGFPVV